MLTIAKH